MTHDQLQTILTAHKQWLGGDSTGKRANLSGSDLRDADLRDADLRDADLSGSDLSGAILRSATMRRAILRSATLHGADLSGAILHFADLSGAILRGAILRDSILHFADLRDADLSGADLSGAILRDGIKAKRLVGLATRGIDSYVFYCIETDSESDRFYYIAGCRSFTRQEFERHIESEYPGTEKASKTRACMDYLESLA